MQADNYPVKSAYKFSKDAMLINLTPHMHLRGKSFRYDLKYPDGKVETILDVPHYDFNWQVTYLLEAPKFVPAGTEMQCLAHFDNSPANLANPDPNSPVSWGDQTWEEMMIGWFTETDDVYPQDVSPDQTRSARFLAALGANPPRLSKTLTRAAEGAAEIRCGDGKVPRPREQGATASRPDLRQQGRGRQAAVPPRRAAVRVRLSVGAR